MNNEAVPVLVNATIFPALVVPTAWGVKVTVDGLSETTGAPAGAAGVVVPPPRLRSDKDRWASPDARPADIGDDRG
jgi:hypothetical protein